MSLRAQVRQFLRRRGYDLSRWALENDPRERRRRLLAASGVDLVLDVGANEGQYAAELRRLEAQGALEPRATRAVLVAAGHGEGDAPSRPRASNPGGLSKREVEVLRLASRGLTTKEIADRLFISAKTTDHHIQHIYNKIGVSTRAAAALWAMQNAVVS